MGEIEKAPPSVSVWRRRPDEPRTARGWIFYTGLTYDAEARRRLFVALSGVFGSLIVSLGVALLTQTPLFWAAPLGASVMVFVHLFWTRRRSAEEHASISTLGGATDGFPVIMEIRAEGGVVGRDHGWVLFVDGWLVYEGLRTEFSFPKSEVKDREFYFTETNLRLSSGQQVRFELLNDPKKTTHPAQLGDGARLTKRFQNWLSEPSVAGRLVAPPGEIHPEIRTHELRTLLFGIVVVGTTTLFLSPRRVPSGGVVAIWLVVVFAFSFRRFQREVERFTGHQG